MYGDGSAFGSDEDSKRVGSSGAGKVGVVENSDGVLGVRSISCALSNRVAEGLCVAGHD
jgi:hypothetical protein